MWDALVNRATARRSHGHESAGAGPTVVYPHRVSLFGKAQDALPLWTEERHVLPHFPIPCGAFDALPPVVVRGRPHPQLRRYACHPLARSIRAALCQNRI